MGEKQGNKVGRPLKYKTDAALQKAIDQYFSGCDEKEEPYTITGLGLAIGLDRHQLIQYGNKDEYYHTIKTAKLRCENYAEKRLYTGQAAGPIFALKNYGWQDKIETETYGKGGGPIEVRQTKFIVVDPNGSPDTP